MKKTFYFIIGFIVFSLISTSVIASSKSDILKAVISSSNQELEGGQEVVVTLRFDQYSQETEGINCFKAKLDYDKEIFEKVLQTNFKTQNNWEELKYNQETGEFVAIKKAGSKKEEEIAQIVLKVKSKEEINPGKTNITIGEIVTSEGKEDLQIEDTKVEINILKDQEQEPEKPEKITSEKYKIEEGYILRIAPETTVQEFRKNVVTEQNMVFTDENGNALKETSKIATGAKLKVGETLNYTLIVIGDTDKDTQITINDLARVKLHLIEYKLLTGIELKSADVDGDNDVTINDIAQIKLILIDLLKL